MVVVVDSELSIDFHLILLIAQAITILVLDGAPCGAREKAALVLVIIIYSLNNGYVEGSFITFLEPVGAPADPKSVVRNLVAPRIL